LNKFNPNFNPDLLYFMENTLDLPDFDSVLYKGDFTKFQPTDSLMDSTIDWLKKDLEKILKKEIHWGESCKDVIMDHGEDYLLKSSVNDITLHYDWGLFEEIQITIGIELNNFIEDIQNSI
jgi:hypothetical protein